MKSVIPNFVACLLFLGMAFSYIKLTSSSDTLTKREAAVLKICAPAIITYAEEQSWKTQMATSLPRGIERGLKRALIQNDRDYCGRKNTCV